MLLLYCYGNQRELNTRRHCGRLGSGGGAVGAGAIGAVGCGDLRGIDGWIATRLCIWRDATLWELGSLELASMDFINQNVLVFFLFCCLLCRFGEEK